MPNCSPFQQTVNDQRAIVNSLRASLNQDLADCADVGPPKEVAQCRAQVRSRLATAEAALNSAEASLQRCLATPDVLEAQGRITFLRVHDLGTGFGPPNDFLDVECVILLDTQPNKYFGFQLRNDRNRPAREGMLLLLREAFATNQPVTIDFFRVAGKNGGTIFRVALIRAPTA
jgi:hypothetical protein